MSETLKLDAREEHFRLPENREGLNIFLRYLSPGGGIRTDQVALYIHGATFPSALSIAHRFDGRSWRDDLNAAGFHVWGLDFLGFGESDRYPEMANAPNKGEPLGRAAEASVQIENAVDFILRHHEVGRISLIAHSWGTMAAGLFAGRCPEKVERLVFFAPIAKRESPAKAPALPAWRLVSLEEQWKRFNEDVPKGHEPVLLKRHFDEWGGLYLDTDPESRTRAPASVKVPNGPTQEIGEAFAGKLAYDPALIKVPVAIVRGEWDHLVTDADAAWLFNALENSPLKRDIKISHGTHLLHLERNRYSLYREAQLFLEGHDQPATAN